MKLLAVVSATAMDLEDNLPERVRSALSRNSDADVGLLVSGSRDEIAAAVDSAASEGVDRVVAVGGDGTVSAVAAALVGGDIPLAIVPLGSGNVLAETLGIPSKRDGAIEMAREGASVRSIDAMRVDGRFAFLNAGIGVSSLTVRDVPHEAKRVFGRLAYLVTGIGKAVSAGPAEFRVAIDGTERTLQAIEVSVVNAALTKERPVFLFPGIRPDDGALDVLVVWAPSVPGFLRKAAEATLGWTELERNVQWSLARSTIVVDANPELPVQADGDIVGTTPVTIEVVRGALGVVTPPGRSW